MNRFVTLTALFIFSSLSFAQVKFSDFPSEEPYAWGNSSLVWKNEFNSTGKKTAVFYDEKGLKKWEKEMKPRNPTGYNNSRVVSDEASDYAFMVDEGNKKFPLNVYRFEQNGNMDAIAVPAEKFIPSGEAILIIGFISDNNLCLVFYTDVKKERLFYLTVVGQDKQIETLPLTDFTAIYNDKAGRKVSDVTYVDHDNSRALLSQCRFDGAKFSYTFVRFDIKSKEVSIVCKADVTLGGMKGIGNSMAKTTIYSHNGVYSNSKPSSTGTKGYGTAYHFAGLESYSDFLVDGDRLSIYGNAYENTVLTGIWWTEVDLKAGGQQNKEANLITFKKYPEFDFGKNIKSAAVETALEMCMIVDKEDSRFGLLNRNDMNYYLFQSGKMEIVKNSNDYVIDFIMRPEWAEMVGGLQKYPDLYAKRGSKTTRLYRGNGTTLEYFVVE